MKTWQTLRIALLLTMIFGAGVLAGRLSVPRPPTSFIAANGRPYTSQDLLMRMMAQLGLDREQKEKFQPILEETVQKMSQLPLGDPKRLEVYRSCMARLRELIRPDQHERFDQLVESVPSRAAKSSTARPGTAPKAPLPEAPK